MIWWKYIDDIFFNSEYGEESLKAFIEQVNIFNSTIEFTAEYSKEEVNFLDANIKLMDGELKAVLFVKPMDTHQFLDPTSCHPYYCKKRIPYSQTLLHSSSQLMSPNKYPYIIPIQNKSISGTLKSYYCQSILLAQKASGMIEKSIKQ